MDKQVLRKLDFLSGKDFPVYQNKLPSRMIYLRDIPEGNSSTYSPWRQLQSAYNHMHLFFSDIYRSPAASAEAYRNKNGVARPGDSGHNYGVSIDFDVDRILKANIMDYTIMCNTLIQFGWTPFQGVNPPGGYKRGTEDWHFNFIGQDVGTGGKQILNWIGRNIRFDNDIKSIQSMLLKLKLYHGDIDGAQGPLMNDAIIKFKSAWYSKNILSLGINKTIDNQFIKMVNIVSCDVFDTEGNLII